MKAASRIIAVTRAARRRVVLAAAVLLLASASGPATAQDSTAGIEEYRLGSGDRLQIRVFGQDDISGEFEISSTGQLAMPLLGEVQAARLTVRELKKKLTHVLDRDFIVDPKVSIEVVNYRPFFILGQVEKPGSYEYQAGITVRMAVALAGGFTRRALEDKILIIRQDEAGEPRKLTVDPEAMVLPGDTVEIGRRVF